MNFVFSKQYKNVDKSQLASCNMTEYEIINDIRNQNDQILSKPVCTEFMTKGNQQRQYMVPLYFSKVKKNFKTIPSSH